MGLLTNSQPVVARLQTQTENYNEEWGELSLNLTALEQRESPVAKVVRLVQEELSSCTKKRDKNLCILLLVDLEVSHADLDRYCVLLSLHLWNADCI